MKTNLNLSIESEEKMVTQTVGEEMRLLLDIFQWNFQIP